MVTKNKKIMKNLKCYFIILNLVFSVIAFSVLVSAADGGNHGGTTTTLTPVRGLGIGGTEVDENFDSATQQGSGGSDGSPTTPPPNTPPAVAGAGGLLGAFGNFSLQNLAVKVGGGAAIFGLIGSLAGGDKGGLWGALAGGIGGAVSALTESALGQTGSILLGLAVAAIIFVLTYKKETKEITEFHCLPWQAPIGGADCELCNDFKECSEYTCKSLGQACQIINPGTGDQKCVWVNPHDVNSPKIDFKEVNEEHIFQPDLSVRPPATGVIVKPTDQECIRAFYPLEFTFITNEPAQCKIDYNLTTDFESMAFFVGANTLFDYNHTEKLALPGPDALNTANPELKNDGEYTLFVRCQDANGNFNQDAFSVSFCVEKGPDITPPVIVDVNVPSGNPVRFNKTSLNLEVYVNEPSTCKWSREDRSYENMEQEMNCDNFIFQMNNRNLYTCRTTLTGIQDRTENNYYFRCKDQPSPSIPEGDKNLNRQSYLYNVIGTQPLNILRVGPNETIRASSDVVPVFVTARTDNGYLNGEALCYFYNDRNNNPPVIEEDYVLFRNTTGSRHVQRQDLVQGSYTYFIKCIDLGGNTDYRNTSFVVETDRSAPLIIRAYRDTELKIVTNEEAVCTYSDTDCNFEVESGIDMFTLNSKTHTAEWVLNKNYYIRCKDGYNNQPAPNSCSIIVRPSQTRERTSTGLEFGF